MLTADCAQAASDVLREQEKEKIRNLVAEYVSKVKHTH
jgi:hypothetical protein